VNSSAAAAAANPGDATLAARAAAFAAFATSYVSNITTAAQNAANAATTAQATANAAALATLTADVTTATNAINEFYDDVVADNAAPPPKPTTDANGNLLPTATQTIQGQISAANAGWHRLAGFAAYRCALAQEVLPLVHHSATRQSQSTHRIGTPTLLLHSYHRTELQRQSKARSTRPARFGFRCMYLSFSSSFRRP